MTLAPPCRPLGFSVGMVLPTAPNPLVGSLPQGGTGVGLATHLVATKVCGISNANVDD
jgi:hypothetical protein